MPVALNVGVTDFVLVAGVGGYAFTYRNLPCSPAPPNGTDRSASATWWG